MPIRPLPFAGLVLAILLPCSAAADDWVTWYYKQPSPDRFVIEVRALGKAGVLSDGNTAVPMAVFLGRVMAANPERSGEWLNQLQDFQGPERESLLLAAQLSGAKDALAFIHRQPDATNYEGGAIDTRALDPADPVVLDMQWADFFATGDAAPVRRVVFALNYEQYSGAMERYKSSKKTEKDREDAIRESTFNAARWSLESNIRQHARVAEIAEQIFFDGELTQPERVWLAAILAKGLPEKYEMSKTKPGEWTLQRRQ